MDFQFYGANCIRIGAKEAAVVVDDNLAELGAKSITKPADIALFTMLKPKELPESRLVISEPGEYEVANISIHGIAARSHMDEAGQKSATIFRIVADDVRVAVIGHVYPDLNDEQLEALGTIDVMFIPVGDSGFTLDGVGALKLIKKIEPKVVIPTHYADSKLKFEVPAVELEEALKAMAMEPAETVPKLKIKAGELSDVTKLIVLERQ